MEVKSPCVNKCQLNSDKICNGCKRTIYEIDNWNKLTNLQKSEINKRSKKERGYYD